MQCRARNAFKSEYGQIRIGNVFTCEAALAQGYAGRGDVEILPGTYGSQTLRVITAAPRIKEGKRALDGKSAAVARPDYCGLKDRWRGETVVCIASGPSLTAEDVNSVRGKAKVIVVNTSFRLAPWADVLHACDAGWWTHYFAEAVGVMGTAERWTCAARARDQFHLNYIVGSRVKGLSKKPDQIHTGGNSGYQAIGLAHLWGAKRILLLGYDMMRSGGRTHWHADHPSRLGNGGRFHEWCKEMNALASDAKQIGLEIINCSRKTALTCFPRSTIQEAL
jgi:hypothetical protein